VSVLINNWTVPNKKIKKLPSSKTSRSTVLYI
jgi:hypothetical protein